MVSGWSLGSLRTISARATLLVHTVVKEGLSRKNVYFYFCLCSILAQNFLEGCKICADLTLLSTVKKIGHIFSNFCSLHGMNFDIEGAIAVPVSPVLLND